MNLKQLYTISKILDRYYEEHGSLDIPAPSQEEQEKITKTILNLMELSYEEGVKHGKTRPTIQE